MINRNSILRLPLIVASLSSPAFSAEPVICHGMCDASAVVPAGGEWFVAADDEDSILRVYSRAQGGAAVRTFDLSSFLRCSPNHLKWTSKAPRRWAIVSTGSRPTPQQGRQTTPESPAVLRHNTTVSNGMPAITPVGRPYQNLIHDLITEAGLKRFDLSAASLLPPDSKNALNIEGLCARPEGGLWVAFRNPVPDGKALIVPLLNPEELIADGKARFGGPVLVDLGGYGIRSLARGRQGYWIIAGSYNGKGRPLLYSWDGTNAPRRFASSALGGLNPEAIESLEEDGAEKLLVLSDDGSRDIGGEDCRDLEDAALKHFRATTLDVTRR